MVTITSRYALRALKLAPHENKGTEMKMKHVIWMICALFVVGGALLGRAMWRAHRQLVTLDVYRMPLAQVLQMVERQTWTRIRAHEKLDARITLHVADQPLEETLERIAGQAGARLTTVFAAYVSRNSVGALESALRKSETIEAAGWTKVAPKASKFDGADEDTFVGAPVMKAPPGDGAVPPGGMRMMVRRGANGVTVMDDGSGAVEEWSPTELLVESMAKSRLGDDEIESANDERAAEAAKKIKGQWAKIYVLRKTKFAGFHEPRPRADGSGARPDFERIKSEPLERFAKLTPEERVQRARQRRGPVRIEQNN